MQVSSVPHLGAAARKGSASKRWCKGRVRSLMAGGENKTNPKKPNQTYKNKMLSPTLLFAVPMGCKRPTSDCREACPLLQSQYFKGWLQALQQTVRAATTLREKPEEQAGTAQGICQGPSAARKTTGTAWKELVCSPGSQDFPSNTSPRASFTGETLASPPTRDSVLPQIHRALLAVEILQSARMCVCNQI